MSRTPIAAAAGLIFVAFYIVAAITLPDFARPILVRPVHWTIEAAYWLLAGVAWVIPIRWLMLWAVGKR